MRQQRRSAWIVTMACWVVAATATPSLAQEKDPWAPDAQWLTLRAGYARSWVDGGGYGGLGYGFGTSRMLSTWPFLNKFALGGYVHYERLGQYGNATQIEVPATLELVRHFKWKSPLRPYLGFGGGPFYRKTYRTGEDLRNVEFGYYLTFGANTAISARHLLGVDLRFIRVDESNIPPNPVFGAGSAEVQDDGTLKRTDGTHWSVKLGYTFVQ